MVPLRRIGLTLIVSFLPTFPQVVVRNSLQCSTSSGTINLNESDVLNSRYPSEAGPLWGLAGTAYGDNSGLPASCTDQVNNLIAIWRQQDRERRETARKRARPAHEHWIVA